MTVQTVLVMLNGFGYDIFRYFLSFLWQSTLVLMAVMALLHSLKGRTYAIRHGILLTAVLILPFSPLISELLSNVAKPVSMLSIAPTYHVPIERTVVHPLQAAHFTPTSPPSSVSAPDKSPSPPVNMKPQPPVIESATASEVSIQSTEITTIRMTDYPWLILLAVYLTFFFYLMARIVMSSHVIDRWIRNGRRIVHGDIAGIFSAAAKDIGVSRPYTLYASDEVVSPMTVGLLRTAVVIPKRLLTAEYRESLRSIALHELSHVTRLDALTLMVMSVLRSLFFFQPLYWLASRQLSLLAEHACDERVVAFERQPYSYARMLTNLAESLPTGIPETELAVGLFFTRTIFFERIKSICRNKHMLLKPMDFKIRAVLVSFSVMVMAVLIALPLGELRATETQKSVSGVVMYEGEPVEGADIFLSDPVRNTFRKLGVTDENGTFDLAIPNQSYIDAINEKPAFVAIKDGYGASWCFTNGLDGLDALYIEMNSEGVFSGCVADEDGKPLANAEIAIERLGVYGYSYAVHFDTGLLEYRAKTDRSGVFEIASLPENAYVMIGVKKDGYSNKTEFCETISSKCNVTMERESRISGRVIHVRTKKGVSDAKLYVKKLGFTPVGFTSPPAAVTNKDGEFVVSGLTPSEYSVYAFTGDRHPLTGVGVARNVIVDKEGDVGDVEILLEEGGFVSGRLLEEKTGFPIANHPVMAYDSKYEEISSEIALTNTDNDGYFCFRLPEGDTVITTMKPSGYLQPHWWKLGRTRNDFSVKVDVNVASGDTVCVDKFIFSKGHILRGTLTTKDGVPVSRVRLQTDDDYEKKYYMTNENGQFRISGLPDGYSLYMTAKNEEKQIRGIYEYEVTESCAVDFVMEEYEVTSLNGRVVNNLGEYVSDALVNLFWFSDDSGAGRGGIQQTATTGNTGQFEFQNLIVGDTYYLMAQAEGHVEEFRFFPEKKFVGEKGGMRAGDIVIEKKGERWLKGHVLNQFNEPVVGAQIIHNHKSRTRTATDGHFNIEGISHVCESISFSHPVYGDYTFPYLRTNTTHTLTMIKGEHHLSGRIVDSNGEIIRDASMYAVQHRHPSGKSRNFRRNVKEGVFNLTGLIEETIDVVLVWPEKGRKRLDGVKTDRDDITLVFDKPDEQEEKWDFNPDQTLELDASNPPELNASKWLSGTPVEIDKLKGKIAILYFRWPNEWEKGQYEYLRYLQVMSEEYGPKGVTLVAVHSELADMDDVMRGIGSTDCTIPVVVDKNAKDGVTAGKTFDAYGINGRSMAVIIGKDHAILKTVPIYDVEDEIITMLK